MKKIIIVLIAYGVLLIVSAGTASAETGVSRGLIKQIEKMENKATRASTLQENQVAKLKEKGNTMIEKRINDLDKLTTKIQNDKRLTEDQKTSLLQDVSGAKNGLISLKEKINNDTDITVLKSDLKRIVTEYRVYAIIVPKMRHLIVINRLENLSQKMIALVPQLQTLINNLKNEGKDVSALQTLLDDINLRLQNINSLLATDKTKIMSVTTATVDSKTIFSQSRKDLASVRSEFAKIREDLAKMRNTFRINYKSATPSAKVK